MAKRIKQPAARSGRTDAARRRAVGAAANASATVIAARTAAAPTAGAAPVVDAVFSAAGAGAHIGAPALAELDFPIAGVAASAGGLEAFSQLLSALPADAHMALVFVLHLSPHRDSQLAVLLAAQTRMPVVQISDGMLIESGHVYVTPPNVQIDIDAGRLRLRARPSDASQHTPADHFLMSLAQAAQSRAIGIVLSGTAADGSLGLREIKAVGGITLAQEPKSAKFDGMPRAAMATGAVDLVLPPRDIAQQLGQISRHPFIRPSDTSVQGQESHLPDGQLPRIFALLRRASGVDFTHYKLPTIKRRLQRRMVLHRIDSIEPYVKYLQGNADEVNALYRDLLIQVTRFFREPESFKTLAEAVFPTILSNRQGNDDPIRIWVPGCASGEEPYSVAIALLETLGEHGGEVPIQIFATDVSELAIEQARAGLYQENINADVSPERLRRFFTRVDGSYRISKSVRDLCVFARQDLTRDPPFSRLDLIVCRNVLIYLGVALQKRLMSVFHYALKPSGFLLLGAAETVGPSELFSLVDKRHRLYAKKSVSTRADMSFRPLGTRPAEEASAKPPALRPSTIQNEANRIILERYAPAAVVVDRNLQITYFRGQTGTFLEPAPGEASLSVLKMAREGLLHGLRSALTEAQRRSEPVRRAGLRVRQDGRNSEVDIEVVPVDGTSDGPHFLILFERPSGSAPSRSRAQRAAGADKAGARGSPQIAQLEQELAASREYLQSIIQDLEAANEELQSANEEILSSNEELQSTNEELDTAKEELQSTNEELNTVNEELHSRNEELTRVNSDLVNLLGSIQIGIVMVSGDLRICRFTPMAERILNLIPADVGRPISDIKPNIDCPDLDKLITEAVDSVVMVERDVHDRHGATYTLRIRPYRSVDNRIDGAVLALFDLDAGRDGARLTEYGERVGAVLMDGVHDPLVLLDQDLHVKRFNSAFEHRFGADGARAWLGLPLQELGAGRWNVAELSRLLRHALTARTGIDDLTLPAKPGRDGVRPLRVNARLLPGLGGRPIAILLRMDEDGSPSTSSSTSASP